jgi:hypothetical protein
MTGRPRVYIILSENRLDARRVQPLEKQPNRQVGEFTGYSLSEVGVHPDNEYYAAPCRSP